MKRDDILQINSDAIFYDGLDDAIIGVAERINLNQVVAYDKSIAINIILSNLTTTEADLTPDDIKNGVTVEDKKYEEALEHFQYNVLGGWVGENTPIFITTV